MEREFKNEQCKLHNIYLPNSVINWITDFLTNRLQRIKLIDN